MIGIKTIREQTSRVREALKARNMTAPIDEILESDVKRRALLVEVENGRAERKEAGKAIGKAKNESERTELIAKQRSGADQLDELESQLKNIDLLLNQLLLEIPNLPHPDLPLGGEENAEVILMGNGTGNEELFDIPKSLEDFTTEAASSLPHWDIGRNYGYIDFERGVKVSGSPFYMLRSDGARMQRALINWMLDLHHESGFEEVYPPFVVRTEPLVGTGQLPKFSDNLFGIENSDLWLVPTAEVPITNMYRDEILDHTQLPIRHSAYTACFRREQFSAGREVRGIKRGYQFDKVEMVVFTRESESWEMLEVLLQNALDVVRKLGLRYRVLRLASGDIGFSASMTYDIEIWSPGSGEWLEVSSVSNFTDFQARRAGLRYRSEDGTVKHLHTLNGSGLGIPRTFAAILEQNVLPDGRVLIPTVLQPYLGNQEYLLPVESV